jgi:signal-transduction protein with cAMP-binding, CBS, and nucleotidyltransferase domain
MTDTGSTPAVTTIGELPQRVPVAVAPTVSIEQAARIMRAHDISALLVGEPGDPVSIVTERDITRCVAEGRLLAGHVGDVATEAPLTVSPDDTVMDVATLMLRERIRHAVVTRDHRVVGVVSMREALAALVTAVTPGTVFVRMARLRVDPPEMWLG